MAPSIKLNLPLQKLAGQREKIEVTAIDVRQCLEDLARRLPGVRQHVFNPDGSLAIMILLNNEPLPGQDLDHPVSDGDELWLLSIVTGG